MDRYVTHATFSLERRYPVPVHQVFAAWADPDAKARWFAGGPVMTFESFYRDIVLGQRIVYSSTLSTGDEVVTVSLTTVELSTDELGPGGDGTRLVLTEQGTYLDGREDPSWREHGTGDWLDALGAELTASQVP
jgi:uncharacterized protein YndB with AHSA1/START domain